MNAKMIPRHPNLADVAELADALDLGSSARKGVEVQVLSSAPIGPALGHQRLELMASRDETDQLAKESQRRALAWRIALGPALRLA